MAPDVRRLPAADGVDLHALVWPGDGPPLVLVHGLASNCRTWEAVGERLHRLGHAVAAIDLRGHGRSDKPDGGYDFDTMSDDLLAVIDGLGFRSLPVVAGQSTGGNLAVHLAHRFPDRVSAVVGVDGGSIELQHQWPDWDDCARTLAPPRLAGMSRSALADRLRRSHPTWDDAGVDSTLANFEILDDDTVRPWLTFDRHMRILRALWEHRPSKVLADLVVAVHLLLVDAEDAWGAAKRDEARRAEALGVRVRWFPGADHDVHVQQPDDVAAELHGVAGDGAAR